MFHTVRPRGKNDIKLKDGYRSCLHSALTYDVKSVAFYCVATGICGFVALATARIWLELDHSSADPVIFCTYENADYEIYKDLMSTVYFPVSKIHLTDNYMKGSSNNDCIVNVTNFEISHELGQNLSGRQIYSSTESPKESSKRIGEKVDSNVVRDNRPSIPLGLINYGEKMFVSLTLSYRSCIFYHYLEIT